jgi:hypothetical protein
MMDSILRKLYPQLYNVQPITKEVIKEVPVIKEVFVEKIIEKIKEVPVVSPIDKYLSKNYSLVKNIAYENKRQMTSQFTKAEKKNVKFSYSVYLNQMITPNAYEVQKFKKPFTGIVDLYMRMQKMGDEVAKKTKWVAEQDLYFSGDNYSYPEETLTGMSQHCDCDDVSAVMASFEPDYCAICWGWYYPQGKSKNESNNFGHAFPVFLWNDKLYIVETTGDSVEIVEMNDDRYEVIYFVTKDNTYKVKGGVVFGRIVDI